MGSSGVFLALEGVDGAGKTTQIDRLVARLESAGRSVVTVREPGGTELGEVIRRILLERSDLGLGAEAELLLFLASRVQLYDEVIAPALARGDVVVSDRYHLSTVVYQGIARGLGEDRVVRICEQVLDGRTPHRNVVLEIPFAESRERRRGEGNDRIEADEALLKAVVDGFHTTAGLPGDSIVRVDGRGDVDTVAAQVWEGVSDVFS